MSLSELFETWRRWNSRDVAEQAARQAEARGDHTGAAVLRASPDQEPAPSAIEALAAQHELAELLAGWRWHTVAAAREQGGSWEEIAEAIGTVPTAHASAAERARDEFREQVTRAEQAAAHYDVPFRDAERYRAASRDDTSSTHGHDDEHGHDDRDDAAERAFDDDEEHDMGLFDRPDIGARQGAAQERLDRAQAEQIVRAAEAGRGGADGFRERVGGVEHIAGPDVFDEGLVVGELALPGGLPPEDDEEAELASPDGRAWVESEEGQAHVARWAAETADPARAEQPGPGDDPDELTRRLDGARLWLTGYTWRDGVDRDEAITARREQLAHWHDDDHADSDEHEVGDDSDGILPNCLIDPDDQRWSS